METKIKRIEELLNLGETVVLYCSGYYAETTKVLRWDSEENILKVYSGYGDNIHDRTEYVSVKNFIEEEYNNLDNTYIFRKDM